MSEINWVKERAACSPLEVFNRLELDVKGDVEVRNKQLREAGEAGLTAKFDVTSRDRIFKVFLNGNVEDVGSSVTFVVNLHDGTISANSENPPVALKATLTLNDKGECRLLVGDQELELWRFRQRALEGLLFGF